MDNTAINGAAAEAESSEALPCADLIHTFQTVQEIQKLSAAVLLSLHDAYRFAYVIHDSFSLHNSHLLPASEQEQSVLLQPHDVFA
jgi:hypothetical protein